MIKKKASICLFVILTVLSIPAYAPALERSSKRDCAVCHVMWIDDFRTENETLIEWQPGNVLMKDTQGVVSSEEICYSCHDGYVSDSRYIVDQHQQHKIFVKPSNKVTIPVRLPLSNKDEIYCGTCHTAHGPGAPPAGNLPAPASFFRFKNVDSTLCEMCHTEQAAFKRSNSHPLKSMAVQLPEKLFELGGKKAQDRNAIICQSCHKVHGAIGDRITIVNNENSELCLVCHDKQKSLIDTKHDFRITLPREENINKQSVSQSGPCGACHTPHNAAGKKLWAKRLEPGNPASRMCLTCHGDESGYEIKRIGRRSHPVDIHSASKLMTDNLPLFSADGTDEPAGTVQCFTCHDVHNWDPGSLANKGQINVEGNASNSFLRITGAPSSTLCMACHNDKKPVISTDHNLNITAPQAKNRQKITVLESGPCGACHIPHNAAGPRLWARKMKPGDFASQACISCHEQNVGFRTKLIGRHSHPLNVELESRAEIAVDLPLFFANGTRNPIGKVQCLTCHDAHRWDPEVLTDNQGQNREGDGSNSFLRIASSRSSTLCIACHIDKKQLIASDHNLEVTAPAEKNLQGLTARDAGPCSACHIPHNAAGSKLWSKQMSGDKDYLMQLCTGCHNQNGAAQAKLIGANDHPVNISFNKSEMPEAVQRVAGDLPLYGDKGNGNISPGEKIVCLTCHEPHTWDPRKSSPVLNKTLQNSEGDATNSFLRKTNFPSPDLCETCHIKQALVFGTDHDMNVSAPQATNLRNQTVKASGQCGVCHLVHNSPHKLKLWARSYGPVSKNQNQMNALCTGCHSKGSNAEKKIPLTATHPAGKLITNVMRSYHRQSGFTPIFDEDGRQRTVGDLSCPSCHNVHQWSPFVIERNKAKNPEETGSGRTRYKFLRNMSYDTVCADCHGREGLFRYLYFHDPDKRSKR